MAYSPDMMMSPEQGPIDPQAIMDHLDHPEMDVPMPELSPRMKHSVASAGDELPNPFMPSKPTKKGKPKPIKPTPIPDNRY